MIATVILDISTKQLNQQFDYYIPKELKKKIKVGIRVVVPFNKQKRLAYVIEIKESSKFATKAIFTNLDEKPFLTNYQLELVKYIQEKSFVSFEHAFKTVVPRSLHLNTEYQFTVNNNDKLPNKFKSLVKNNIISLKKVKDQDVKEFIKLTTKNIIEKRKIKSKEPKIKLSIKEDKVKLNLEQVNVLKNIKLETFNKYLVFGPPASGKTEIILNLIESTLKESKQVLILVPEIGLIPQMAKRITTRFNIKPAIYHSKLTGAEKYNVYQAVRNNLTNIVVGTRSSLFLPFKKLSSIILDEAHDLSYIQKTMPYYDSKEIAEFITKRLNIPLIFLTATPTISMVYEADFGILKLLKLTKTIFPIKNKIKLIDMKEELIKGNTSILSSELKLEIKNRLDNQEQVIILVNRKGYAPFVLCRTCGYVIKCPTCQVSLVYHKKANKYICHHCSYEQEATNDCPVCKSDKLRPVGFALEQVEEALNQEYPNASIVRMDTTIKSSEYDKILDKFLIGKTNILIGTEMVSKGHHFENVSLVAVLLVDQMLQLSSYLANEKTYALLTQHIGRIRKKEGLALIQTYNPDHFVLKSIVNNDFKLYYNYELEIRRALSLEPFYNVVKLTFKGLQDLYTFNLLNKIKRNMIAKNSQLYIIGPTQDYVLFKNNRYHYSLTIKSPKTFKLSYIFNYLEKRYYDDFLLEIDYYPDQI